MLNEDKETLIQEINKLRSINRDLIESNEKLSVIASDKMINNKLFIKMEKENQGIHKLENENIRLKSKIKHLENINKEQSTKIYKLVNEKEKLQQQIADLKNVPYLKYPGGRPSKFDEKKIKEIKKFREETNATYKVLSEKYDCSVGLVHKLLNEK